MDFSVGTIADYFSEVFQFIEEGTEQEKNVLVHCKQGRSRYTTIVIGYIMYMERLTLPAGFSKGEKGLGILSILILDLLSSLSCWKEL